MPIVQRFAQVFGAVYVLVGVLGFIPPLLIEDVPGVLGPFAGLLLTLFAVNWFHNLAHLAVGAAGLTVYRNHSASKAYALALGVAYAALFVLGVLTADVATPGRALAAQRVSTTCCTLRPRWWHSGPTSRPGYPSPSGAPPNRALK